MPIAPSVTTESLDVDNIDQDFSKISPSTATEDLEEDVVESRPLLKINSKLLMAKIIHFLEISGPNFYRQANLVRLARKKISTRAKQFSW